MPEAPPPTPPPPPPDPAPPDPAPREATVNGCNSYGANCDGNPIYATLPPPGYDWATWPKVGAVDNGETLLARCWGVGGTTTNYASGLDPPDLGPDPYESDLFFFVLAPGGAWGWIPDTYFARDKVHRLGLPPC
ncbi:MAG TPA: hypothetical protein VFI47_04515 [Acidimicrobiales bacterium]|nr:hypothetical protein [Acidimicrobiales bacterium]